MEYFAYVGGGLLGVKLIPQIYKTHTLRSAEELSWSFLLLNMTGLGCMGIYSFSTNDAPILIPVAISFGMTVILAMMKIYYHLDKGVSEPIHTEMCEIRYPSMTPEV